MANLVSRLALQQVAWEFDSSIRVFKVPSITVTAKQDIRKDVTASGKYYIDYVGIWLTFNVNSSWFKEQVSGTATDRIDILNALTGSGTVKFYPDWLSENDPKPNYEVKTDDTSITLLSTNKGLFNAAQSFKMHAVNRLDAYPDWLKYT